MAYTTIDRVNELLPDDNKVDSETSPTYAVVDTWLPPLDSAINVAYALGGNVLLNASADVLTWFGLLVTKEAAYQVMQVRGATKEKESLWQGYHADWLAALTLISNKEQAASIATPSGPGNGTPSSYTTQDPQLTRDKVY